MKNGLLIFIIIGGVLLGLVDYCHTETHTIVVNDINMQQKVSGDKNEFKTEYNCMIYSDNGAFEIEQSGWLYANPSIIGKIKVGDTITVTTRGFEILPIGQFRKIVELNNR